MGNLLYPVFEGCSSLTKITVGNMCKSLADGSFKNCHSLTEVWIGKNVNTIGAYAFGNCEKLSRIYSLNTNTPICEDETVFENVNKNKCTLYVPDKSTEIYSTTYVWWDFAKITGKDFSGVEETLVDENSKPAEYYNLQGVKVDNPENGIFIKKQGSRTTKTVR